MFEMRPGPAPEGQLVWHAVSKHCDGNALCGQALSAGTAFPGDEYCQECLSTIKEITISRP